MGTQPNGAFSRCDSVGGSEIGVSGCGALNPRLTRSTLSRRSIRSM
jgi:hypothetical protein